MIHEELQLSLGSLLVGSLADEESAELRAHLVECDDCRAAYDEIAGLLGLLATVSAAEAESGPPHADSAMLNRLMESVRVDRRRQRIRRIGLGVAAAAVAAVLAGGAVVVVDRGDSTGVAGPGSTITATASPGEDTVSAADASTGVSADIALRQVAWGTVATLDLRGVEAGYSCSLVAVAADGTREVSASWTVPTNGDPAEGSITITGATGLPRSMIKQFEIVKADGTMLLIVAA